MYNSIYYEIKPKSWEDAKRVGKCLKQPALLFVFRGQGSNEWQLKTSIERVAEKYREDFSEMWMFENQIIDKFKTRAYQYIQSPPDNEDIIEWLSIIQHFGGGQLDYWILLNCSI